MTLYGVSARVVPMKPTDTNNPEYFHQVVNCQWACPAHTDVPEYIRLIAHEKYHEAYLLNRESNVFPGILGRVCDRPCEPACRRGRIRENEKPIAICRLKRVAADHKGRVEMPSLAPKNGKRVALIGGGPASLTVANDLLPLGYEVELFERHEVLGGLMRSNIPAFRLPAEVLNEEIELIARLGLKVHLNHPISSLKSFLEKREFDAYFVGTGAPRGKDLEIPGRAGRPEIHIGMEWLESVAFEHIDKIGNKVVIIGAGNTAMDCARTSKRLGGKNICVVARRSKRFFAASPWELEETEEEGVQLIENHSPRSFVLKDGKLVGVEFTKLRWDEGASGKMTSTEIGTEVIECSDVILAIGQERFFPFVERDIGIEFDSSGLPKVDPVTMQSTREEVFFGGDAAFGPKNIIWAVAHGHQAALSIDLHCQGKSPKDRPSIEMQLESRKMGYHEWSFDNDFSSEIRVGVPHVPVEERFEDRNLEVELGFDLKMALKEAERCLNCDIQTAFVTDLCIECDACLDICPLQCLSITPNADEEDLRKSLRVAATNKEESLFVSEDLIGTGRVMVKDENVCVHCGLCAEKCPTGAWDMQKSLFNLPYASGGGRRGQ